jgi:hypothetical protein
MALTTWSVADVPRASLNNSANTNSGMSAGLIQENVSMRRRAKCPVKRPASTVQASWAACPLWVKKRTLGPGSVMSDLPPKAHIGWQRVCKPNCKPTPRHGPALGVTGRDNRSRNAELKRTVSYSAAQINTRILELENRCTGNRIVGSNPTLSATPY